MRKARADALKISVTGPQGSGKTTQAKLLADFLGLPMISTGEILRQKSLENNEIGKEIKSSVDKGEMVNDEIVHRLIGEKINEVKNGFVMDGYPRSLGQLDHLDPHFDKVFYLEINDDLVKVRLLKRGRADDSPEIIAERLELYHQLTEPLLLRYKDQGILQIIDGSGSIDEIQNSIREKLNES